MATTDSVSVFAEGTFEDQVRVFFSSLSLFTRGLTSDPGLRLQIRELVDYLARGLSDDDRQKSFGQVLELVKAEQPPEDETPQAPPAISQEAQVKVFSLLIPEVKGLGDGSEKGARCLVSLWPVRLDQLRCFP